MRVGERPVVVSTRMRVTDRALLRAYAEAHGMTVSEAVHHLLMPAVRESLADVIGEDGGRQAAEPAKTRT